MPLGRPSAVLFSGLIQQAAATRRLFLAHDHSPYVTWVSQAQARVITPNIITGVFFSCCDTQFQLPSSSTLVLRLNAAHLANQPKKHPPNEQTSQAGKQNRDNKKHVRALSCRGRRRKPFQTSVYIHSAMSAKREHLRVGQKRRSNRGVRAAARVRWSP